MGHLITVSLTVSQKSVHVYIYDNFGKRGPIFIFFTVKFRKDLWRKMELKLPPSLKSVATLPCENQWSTIPLYSTVDSDQSDEICLNTVSVHNGCHVFVFLQRLICVMCLKCPPLAKMPCFESWMPLVNECINCALFDAVSNVYLHNWEEWVMQQIMQ